MHADSGIGIKVLRVDGGMTANNLVMQFQSDLLDIPLHRPEISETTSLGAAFAAGETHKLTASTSLAIWSQVLPLVFGTRLKSSRADGKSRRHGPQSCLRSNDAFWYYTYQ